MYRSQRNRLQRQRNSHSKISSLAKQLLFLAAGWELPNQWPAGHVPLAFSQEMFKLPVCHSPWWCSLSAKAWLVHQEFGPSENEINRNRAKYVKSHFSPGLFHTNVWSCTYCCSTLWVTHQSDCSPSAMRQHHLLLLRSNRLGQVCETPITSKCCS